MTRISMEIFLLHLEEQGFFLLPAVFSLRAVCHINKPCSARGTPSQLTANQFCRPDLSR